MADLTTLKRRRGVAKASLTRLATRLTQLEGAVEESTTISHAELLRKKLETLDAEFKTHHLAVIDAIEDDETAATEQDELDRHDDNVASLQVRLETLLATPALAAVSTPSPDGRVISERRLDQLDARLSLVNTAISTLTSAPKDLHLVDLYQEQLGDFKKDLSEIRNDVLMVIKDGSDALIVKVQQLDRQLFDLSVTVKHLMYNPESPSATLSPSSSVPASESRGVKFPKIDVPTFSGELLHWQSFWEQFCIAIHNRKDISATEKLVYLRHSLKDGSAKSIIEGLSSSGDQYPEAIASLQTRFDRPRLLHQTHVKKIYEIPNLKEGSGKELRKFHDLAQQHLRALKAMGQDPSGPFITSLLELKLDQNTLFEWQKCSQSSKDIPHYTKLLDFLNLRAQASESCSSEAKRFICHDVKKQHFSNSKQITSFVASTLEANPNCVVCKTDKHPLYACPQFKALPHDKMLATVRSNNLCLNCLRPGHFSKNCKSNNHCKKCQRPHHTFLHVETKDNHRPKTDSPVEEQTSTAIEISSHTQSGSSSSTLLMTCQIAIHAPDGSSIRARGILDSGSSASFVSERLAQSLRLRRSTRNIHISGVAGISHNSPIHSVAAFEISSLTNPADKLNVSAIVVPHVTRDLPVQPVHFKSNWSHLSGLYLSDPEFGQPGKIDVLLGVDVYANVMLQGRRSGQPGTPVALETKFGWVLAGKTNLYSNDETIQSHHITISSGDDILRKFWEIEESPKDNSNFSPEERTVVRHFADSHTRTKEGRFIVPLPKNPQAKTLGESRQQAVRRFLSLERSLHSKQQFSEFSAVMEEYMQMDHAELVPVADLQKPSREVFYMPMHAVRKEHSTTTKIRAVFDASAKSSSGVSLNDTLLVGPTVHSTLIDVLLRFRLNQIALTTDVSKMYRAVELAVDDRDFHRFLWRNNPDQPLQDFRMTRVTFGVSASPFAANMALKQNAVDHTVDYPLAAEAVQTSFYVDDGLTGANSVEEAIKLQEQLQALFDKGGFLLRTWNSSCPQVLQNLSPELKDSQPVQMLPASDQYTKTLGIAWNAKGDHFRLTIADPPPLESITKRALVSDIAKTFDVLGWFSPSTIKAKIFLQQLWEQKVDWDEPVPIQIRDTWFQWRSELPMLSEVHVPRCYFSKHTSTNSMEIQIHGFSDASEAAYAVAVYLRISDDFVGVQTSLVMSKTKVAPIKKLTIPRLELCGAYLLAQLLHHVRQVLKIPLSHVYAWTDSTIVLNWLDGSPRRLKTYVGNRVSTIVDLIPPDKWKHVRSTDNPADCASRGVYPSELIQHPLWWNGPPWLKETPDMWPPQIHISPNKPDDEEKEINLSAVISQPTPVISLAQFSSFNRLKRVTVWIMRFVRACQKKSTLKLSLTTEELQRAETYWLQIIQQHYFPTEIEMLQKKGSIAKSSALLPLQPFIDSSTNLLRVGGRRQLSQAPYSSKHPIVLHGKHPVTHMIIRDEHQRLLHAGPTPLPLLLGDTTSLLVARLFNQLHENV